MLEKLNAEGFTNRGKVAYLPKNKMMDGILYISENYIGLVAKDKPPTGTLNRMLTKKIANHSYEFQEVFEFKREEIKEFIQFKRGFNRNFLKIVSIHGDEFECTSDDAAALIQSYQG